ncbi:MAG: AMP-binding protein [Pseudomonadales bacterium]|nr:AMP-binding protein [Pseudomonadales bacterium]MDG1303066.1 AMP-binding protein [Pseudomonadales bacterium]MDG1910334.1 AMP-binding protein [Pseudomonadales bacterium]|tara:strand:+ start:1436 stop:3121 length:1686 start_codon:yes stop_codon:yes gene_type:complete
MNNLPKGQSYLCGQANEPLLYETIGACVERIAATYPDKEALVVRHQNIRWTFSEYKSRIDALAAGLVSLGVEPGDRVGIWSPNRVEWCLTQFATAKIGAIMVCINPAYRPYELEYALNKVKCQTIITAAQFKTSEYLRMLQEMAPELATCEPGELKSIKLPHLTTVIRMGDAVSPGMFNFDKVCEMGEDTHYDRMAEIAPTLQADDAINIQFTSGTTGSPKGATLSHFNILNNGLQVGAGMRFTSEDRLCIPVPLYHCFGMVMGNLTCMTHGACAVFPDEGFDPDVVLRTVVEEKCTALHGVPTMFVAETDLPNVAEYELSTLRTGVMAGAPCPLELMHQVIDKLNMSEITIMYGQTETSPVNHMTDIDAPAEKRCGTVGRVGPYQEIKIIDESGRVVPLGDKGELCCRGYSVMQGYWDDEARTDETIDATGWLHSGDLAEMDEEGYVQIVGRIKDMIIRGGENVYPREVEEFLYTHPDIQEVQVFGIPDERYGEIVCAWVQLKQNATLNEESVKSFCRDQITHFKVPSLVRFVDEFPMTVTGKIQKFKMRETMIEQLVHV